MKISAISNGINSFYTKKTNNKKTQSPSFKSIYVENNVRLGLAAQNSYSPEFLPKDYLLLNDIATKYPNQDCFIMQGKDSFPRLEYREKPPEITVLYKNSPGEYQQIIEPKHQTYPCVPLLLYPNSNLNRYIGMPSNLSTNPSLPFTVYAGYELHKKIMEKKYQIMDEIGNVDSVNLGEQTLIEKAHEAVEDVEIALTRYLLESAYTSLIDKITPNQLYRSNIPRIQSRLEAKRRIDLTTPTAKQPFIEKDDVKHQRKDICEIATEEFPNTENNKTAINKLLEEMQSKGIFLR